MTAAADPWKIVAAIQEKARHIDRLVVELRSQLAQTTPPPAVDAGCPVCGLDLRNRARLADHLHVSHQWDDQRIEAAVYPVGS